MKTDNHNYYWIAGALLLALIVVATGHAWKKRTALSDMSLHKVSRQEEGQLLGLMPNPVHPDFLDPIIEPFTQKRTTKVVIKRIPRITKGTQMPHPYWGDCGRCHLIKGGASAGRKWKSLVGRTLEKVSTIKKVGPPILPVSTRPHPAAGRCIKCHDIVIEAPV
ncbi:MAG: hypothetical protein IEMM0002_0320 [bacterium]|nr:MAG: hypothetical protein IEMM0002_0320 [bacterium]